MARPPRVEVTSVSPWPFVGIALMAAVGFLYAASVLVAPWWAVVLLVLTWLVCFVRACRWWTPHPRRITVMAGVMVLAWFGILVGGAAFLNWG